MLLAGPPGVGKTMAAQVVAAELGVDLLRVNLAETISKYVGETAKNLDAVLRNARDLDAVLLLDEADTLFGRRTEIRDAHDRWANADTNFLLQAIETYPGVAVLGHQPQGPARRGPHPAAAARPGAAQARRRRPADAVADPAGRRRARPLTWRCADLLDRLATRMELTGADIKNAALNAAFVAARPAAPSTRRPWSRGSTASWPSRAGRSASWTGSGCSMAEPATVRIRSLQLRVGSGALPPGTAAVARRAILRQLPPHIDPAVSEPLAAELARAARRAAELQERGAVVSRAASKATKAARRPRQAAQRDAEHGPAARLREAAPARLAGPGPFGPVTPQRRCAAGAAPPPWSGRPTERQTP